MAVIPIETDLRVVDDCSRDIARPLQLAIQAVAVVGIRNSVPLRESAAPVLVLKVKRKPVFLSNIPLNPKAQIIRVTGLGGLPLIVAGVAGFVR